MATKKTSKKAVKAAKPAAAKKAPAKKAASVAKKAELDCTDNLAIEIPAEPAKKPAAKKAAAKKDAAKKPAAPKTEAPVAPKTPVAPEAPAKAEAAPAKKEAAPKKSRVTFSVRAEVGSKVFVAGDFNGWDPTAKQLVDKNGTGLFSGCLSLDKGRYEYKFVINGDWYADPECADWTQNDMGTLNSVKVVD